MSTEKDTSSELCTDCDVARIEKELEAKEAERAATREIEKLRLEKELEAEATERAATREIEKLRLEKELEAEATEEAVGSDLLKAQWTAEAELGKLFHETIAEVAKGSIERSRDSAKYVQTAATAIVAVYASLLALVFSVTDHPLPVRGVYAGVFFGLAVALATAYLAFITKPRAPSLYPGGASLGELQLYRTGFLTKWINATVHDRRWAIRASVLSLAIGVAFVPAAFVSTSRPAPIPDPPVAPDVPSEIAKPITDEATKLFEAQVQGYEEATKARNGAIAEASEQSEAAAGEESDADKTALCLALAGLLLVFLGPRLFDLGLWLVAKTRNRFGSSENG